ncbi:MAG: cytochrome c oxidase subunit 3, partial [Gemmataceae bacterium]
LGVLFMLGTAKEWYGLIYKHDLTIATNLFGTTYYTLVGFHAFHVTLGLVFLCVVFGLAVAGKVSEHRVENVDLISWYWHFVDVVWVFVFTIVYIVGR